MSRNLNKLFLFILLTSLFVPVSVLALVSKIVFTTDSQAIAPGEISAAITIQTQDESGTIFKTPETTDLTLESTSPTGEFVNKSGKVDNKVTMSKNTGNRTVYYRDSTEGNFDITITATLRESGTSWSATQPITISASDNTPEPAPKKTVEPKVEPKKEVKTETKIETVATVTPVVVPVKSETEAVVKPKPIEKKPVVKQAAAVVLSKEVAPATTSTSSNIIYEGPKKEGFLTRIWHFFLNMLW